MTQEARAVVLSTSRLVLTSWLMADVDPLLEIHSDPETMRFVRYGRPETRSETEELVQHYRGEYTSRGWTKWRLADHDGVLMGRAGFGGDDTRRGLSYLIRRSHWGLGLATEVGAALVTWHLRHAQSASLGALAEVGNDASVRILEKIGFREQGTVDFAGATCHSFSYPTGQSKAS